MYELYRYPILVKKNIMGGACGAFCGSNQRRRGQPPEHIQMRLDDINKQHLLDELELERVNNYTGQIQAARDAGLFTPDQDTDLIIQNIEKDRKQEIGFIRIRKRPSYKRFVNEFLDGAAWPINLSMQMEARLKQQASSTDDPEMYALKHDKNFFLRLFRIPRRLVFLYGPSGRSWWGDWCLFLEYAAPKLRADREVVLQAVRQNGKALQYASEELKNDREVVLQAITQNGKALQYASPELQDDEEVVLQAVAQNGEALQYASPEKQFFRPAQVPVVKLELP